MTFPYTIYIHSQPVSLHGLFEFAGVFIAFRYYLFLKRKHGDYISSTNRIYLVTAAALGAVLGSRIVGAAENIPAWVHAADPLRYFTGNKTLVGGLLGGMIAVEISKRIIGERQKSGDLFVYPLLLGMIIGRVGCFTAGVYEETYGNVSSLPWAMDLGDGLLRHPVALYEIVFLIILWKLLLSIQHHWILQQGALFKIFLISYMLFRFLLDFIKPGWRYFMGLGTIQLTCIIGLVYYSGYILHPVSLLKTSSQNAC